MSVHPLTTFVYQTFGQQFGDLLLAGYGAEPSDRHRKLYLTESEAGWVVELVARRQPCRDEPLVLVALLKLLLSRPSISQHLEFKLGELLATLQWQDNASTRRQVETAIGSYIRLLYCKQGDVPARAQSSETVSEGYYHLLTGYMRESKSGPEGALAAILRSVYFDTDFIERLKQGQVYFASIDFGPLQAAE